MTQNTSHTVAIALSAETSLTIMELANQLTPSIPSVENTRIARNAFSSNTAKRARRMPLTKYDTAPAAPFALEIVWQLVSARFSIVIINLRLISLRSLTFTTRVFTLLWDRSITMVILLLTQINHLQTRQIARKSSREHSSKPNAAAESKGKGLKKNKQM